MTNWDDWKYYLGEWIGEGTGKPGEGSGGFNFYFDLQNQILVRKNFAEYPASEDKPSYRHDDLMIIYRESEGHSAPRTGIMKDMSFTTRQNFRKTKTF